MAELIKIIIDLVILGALVWFVGWLPISPPFYPVKYALYALVFIIALVVLLPFLGINLH